MTFDLDPVRAKATFSNGAAVEIPKAEISCLFDALDSRDFWRGPSIVEEGSWIDPRSFERIGGRSEFERSRQRKIIQWLEKSQVTGAAKVMIIGDSIRMRIGDGTGYVTYAYEALIGKANLIHVPHNCGGTVTGAKLMANWMASKPDIVHYNAGLHDLAVFKSGKVLPSKYLTVDQYKEKLDTIFSAILGSGVKTLIWALSTPVDDEWHATTTKATGARRIIRRDADVQVYNDASMEVAKARGIYVNDLYTPLKQAGVRNVVLPDGVHLNRRGSALAGRLVAEALKRFL